MISDDRIEDRLAAILLDADDLQRESSIIHRYKKAFGGGEAELSEVKRAIYSMTRDDRIIEHDLENDTLDGVLMDHSEHGILDTKDITFLDADNLYGLGPELIDYLRGRASFVAEQAISGGFRRAISRLNRLPINSALWTGMPVGFRLDSSTKAQIVRLLQKADDEISGASTSNREVAQAKALIMAALVLTEAPEPESELVWGILQKLTVFISLSQGLEALFKLIKGLYSA